VLAGLSVDDGSIWLSCVALTSITSVVLLAGYLLLRFGAKRYMTIQLPPKRP
jgi:hypothetical protein